MASGPDEDASLPATRRGCSGLVPSLPANLGDVSATAALGNGVLPGASEETVSPTRARNMKDFEHQITELKKENFNLKLRIYFLEERMQQEFDGPTEHICKTNIELKVEVESLKRELQERDQLLRKASKAVESLAEGGGSEVQRVKEEAQKQVQQVEELLTQRIRLLEEDVKTSQAELEKAFAATKTEMTLRLNLENKLAETQQLRQGDLDMAQALEQKDRLIEELKLSLKSKEALIQSLKEEKSPAPDENVSSGELRGLSAALREEKYRESEAAQMDLQEERKHLEVQIQALQEDLREKGREIATEKKNSFKRDKAIQGLTMALKSKEKEVKELNSEIEELKTAFTRAREAAQQAEADKLQGSEDYEAALQEKAALLTDLRSENLSKNTENQKLRRSIKKLTQELCDVQQERGRLERELEEALGEKSRADGTIHDLRSEVEKLHSEAKEREREAEKHHRSPLGEGQKLPAQEREMGCPPESASQKDLMLQVALSDCLRIASLPGPGGLTLRAAVEPELSTCCLHNGRMCSLQTLPFMSGALCRFQEKQQLDYEELIQVLKKEQAIYTQLVKSLRDSGSLSTLQAELNHILALRTQLEQDVLSYQNLKRTLELQTSEIRRREEESFSFYSDQTSYLSICLEEHSRVQVEHFSREELKEKVINLIQLVKELYTDNQHLKKTILDFSCLGVPRDEQSAVQTELLASKEDEDTIGSGEDGETNLPSGQTSEQSNESTMDHSEGGCKNGYFRHTDPTVSDSGGAHKPPAQSLEEGELLTLVAPFFNEKATAFLESRPELLEVLWDLLLEQMCLLEQEVLGDRLDSKTKKTLKQMAARLKGELGHVIRPGALAQPHSAWKSLLGVPRLKAGEAPKTELKDASAQTVAMEGDAPRFRHEGRREAWEEKPPEALCSAEHQPEHEPLHRIPRRQNSKKSRLPIPIKTSRSLGSMYRRPGTQRLVAQLQGQVLELQGELKEFKIRNKHLHQKLILAEAMMEGSPAAEQPLRNGQPFVGAAYQESPGEQKGLSTSPSVWTDKVANDGQRSSHETDPETHQPDDLPISLVHRETPSPDLSDPISVGTSADCKSQFSVTGSGTQESDASDDTAFLKRKILDLEAENEAYRHFLSQLRKRAQCSEAIITVLQDGAGKSVGSADEEEMTFSSLHRVHYVKHMQILHPLTPEMMGDDGVLESLQQQLVEQDCALQKGQNLDVDLFSEIRHLPSRFQDLSPSRYDSLVQSQARELSLHRQQLKDGRGICIVYRQHMDTMIKAFKELLQASQVDYFVAEGFQEQLNQCAELLKKLETLFFSGKVAEVEMNPQNEELERVEETSTTYQHLLPESPGPSVSQALSDFDTSEKSSSSPDQKPDSEMEKTSLGPNTLLSQDLLMEHIQEIRSLRKRLEESIKTNEKLRRQLERQGSEADQGSTNVCAYGSELHTSLTSEIHFLRKQNQALNAMLAKGSRDKQKENEKLRESLSRKTANFERLQEDYAWLKGEKERLQEELDERERQNRSELHRVQEEVELRQHLLQALRVELKVYEKLDKEHQTAPRETRAEAAGEGWRGQDALADLPSLLTEIQALRAQLERSIETNSTLQGKLEQQLAQAPREVPGAARSAILLAPSGLVQPQQLDTHDGDSDPGPVATDHSYDLFDSNLAMPARSASEAPSLSGNDVDSLSSHSSSSATSATYLSPSVPGQRPWASQDGLHVLGLLEHYDNLRTQIGQGQKLLAEMDSQIQEAPSPTGREPGARTPRPVPTGHLVTYVSTARLVLEKAAKSLTLFWRVSLPATNPCQQGAEMKAEIAKLQKKLLEQEKKLQSTMKHLQLSKHQERVIFDQLVVTHKILRKARGNLELRPGGAHAGTPSPSRPGS
ncbi:CDK5 regulatory subunit-associated protein 2 [Sorex fumeus]|uniref:CDK5 regulatory subunit-associated protein 2 n=1 Tax=Sorex fumeus TaxID=62283 RepID=UPI0024AD86E2|nr:CDK5 regulatory subunit-associated protein 2 [Sorex fumeus]